MVQINNTTLSALRAFEQKFQVTANNIANVNTDGFKKSRILLKDDYPAGVEAVIDRVDTPGFLRPAEDGSPDMRGIVQRGVGGRTRGAGPHETGLPGQYKCLKAGRRDYRQRPGSYRQVTVFQSKLLPAAKTTSNYSFLYQQLVSLELGSIDATRYGPAGLPLGGHLHKGKTLWVPRSAGPRQS